MAPLPQRLQPLLLCLLALGGTRRGVPSVFAFAPEREGQKNILQGFSQDEPTGQDVPAHPDLPPDLVLDAEPRPDAQKAQLEEGPPDAKEAPWDRPTPVGRDPSPDARPTLPALPLPAVGRNSSEEEDEEDEEEEGESALARGPSCEEAVPPEAVPTIARGLLRLGADLLRELEGEDPRGNVFLSPLSVGLALAHLALGAGNQTEKRLRGALRAESVPCFHQAMRQISRHLRKTALSLAGRIYLEKGFPVKEKFLEDSEKFYGTKPATLSGHGDADLEAINGWAKEATGGQIPSLLSDLPPGVVLLLLNAVHFRGFWKTKFDPLLTEPGTFHLDEEFAVSVETMKARAYPLSWLTVDALDAQVARFPFKGNTSFVAVLPNRLEANFSQLLGLLHTAHLRPPFPRERPTMVRVPKLHLRYQRELNQALSRLGLAELFCGPNFRPMAYGPLVVSSVQHQAALELAEDGAEASAATSVAMSRSLSAFHLNRPFVFSVLDDATGVPLFLGAVRNPDPGTPPQRKAGGCGRADGGEASRHCGVDPGKP